MGRATLSPLEQSALQTFAHALRQRWGERVMTVRLFGSRARGEGHEDSDLDVLVLLDGLTHDARRAIQDLAYDVGSEHGLVLSPIIADAAEWRWELPLARTIAAEGVSL